MAITFDTLKFANRLKAAGVEPKIAEAHAKAEAEALAEATANQLATKQDILELKAEIKQIRSELIIKLGSIMVAGVALLATLLTIFHS